MCYFFPLLSCKVSGADDAHIFSRLFSTQQLAWSWVTGALCLPLFLALAKSSILSCQSSERTILVTDSNSPSGHFLGFFFSFFYITYRGEPFSWCFRNYNPHPLADTLKSK